MSAANFSCGISPVTDVGPVCGGNGQCVFSSELNRGICICNSGWQGESDFQVTNSYLDCQINVTAIRVIWGVALALFIVIFFTRQLPRARWLWNKHQTTVQRNKQVGKVYRLWDNKGFFATVPYLSLGMPAMCVMAIVKMVNQDLKIGDSVLVTILYIIWRTTFVFAPDNFQPALLASLLRSERNLDHIILLNKNLSRAHLVFFWSLSILPIIPMVVSQSLFNPTVGMISFAVFANLACFNMLILVLQGRYIGAKVETILMNSYAISKDERTKNIMGKIASHQKEVVKGGMLQFTIYGFFGMFPYLWNKHDYLVPFSFIASALQISVALASLVQDEGEKSSTKPTSPALSDGGRKQLAVRNEPDSVTDHSTRDMYIHGLDLDPLANHSTFASTAQSSEGGDKDKPAPMDGAVRVNISPAMKVLRAMTPSRKAATPKNQFNFEQEGLKSDKESENV